jgi:hypothetical protein
MSQDLKGIINDQEAELETIQSLVMRMKKKPNSTCHRV